MFSGDHGFVYELRAL